MLGEAGIDALLGMVTGGISLAGKGGKVLKYADDVLSTKNRNVDIIDDYIYNKIDGKTLQRKLDYSIGGEDSFVPEGASFKNIKVIAGNGSENPIRDINRLVNTYGGKAEN